MTCHGALRFPSVFVFLFLFLFLFEGVWLEINFYFIKFTLFLTVAEEAGVCSSPVPVGQET